MTADLGALLWALSSDMGLDGFRSPVEKVAPVYATACKAGQPLACEVSTGAVPRDANGRLDPHVLGARVDEWCRQSDAVACLVRSMLLVRRPFTGYRTEAPEEDQRSARTGFSAACEAGLARGCTELGMAWLHETWSYPSDPLAKQAFRKACDAKEPEACRQLGLLLGPKEATERKVLLERARDLGNVEAASDLARLADDEAGLRAACDSGSTSACTAANLPEKACAQGNPDACLTSLLRRAIAEKSDRVVLTETLESMCGASDRACREAEFLRDGSPVLATEPGHYASPGLVPRYLLDAKDALRICHVRALKANPDAHGLLDVWMRIGITGQVLGVHIPNPFDAGLADCADRTLMAMKLKAPLEGPMLAHFPLPFEATTRLDVRRLDPDPTGGSLELMTEELQARGEAFDVCIVKNDDPRFIREGTFRATVLRTGVLSNLTWPSADFEEETRLCLEEALAPPVKAAPLIATPFEAQMHFLEEYQVPTWKIVPEPLPPLTPDRLRLLALVPAGSDVEGTAASAPPDAAARIEQVHARLAELVAGFTKGGLRVETDVRTLPATVSGATLDVEDEELTRLRFEAFDLPDTVWSTLPVGRYDGIVLWVPIPKDRTAAIGTTTNATLRGAPFSALPLPSAPDRSPRVETLLHAVWSQYAARAQGELGVYLPSPDQALEAEGKSYDNEFWTLDPYRKPTTSGLRMGNQTGDAMPYYSYLFRKVLHPAMRADLARIERADVAAPDDLALLSTVLREGGARNAEVLTDGRRSLNPPEGKAVFQDGSWLAADRSEDDLGWWGVSWPSPIEVRRIRVRLGDGPAGPPTVKKIQFEGRSPEGWVPLNAVSPSQADVTLTLPATRSFDGVRVRVLERLDGDVSPTCFELEVYASPK